MKIVEEYSLTVSFDLKYKKGAANKEIIRARNILNKTTFDTAFL